MRKWLRLLRNILRYIYNKTNKKSIRIIVFLPPQINPKQARVIYEILRLHNTDEENVDQYKQYRLDIKKRLNLTFHKQKADAKKLEKSGIDPQWITASMPTVEERIEQLRAEYQEVEDEYRAILVKLDDDWSCLSFIVHFILF